ncbi:serine/threonine protein kinase [Haloactinospora alba]|uniref:non-specific serine/threonine protein kinase n=1 Tax=Haloactinospora alba TaxID=405555 RepID=A0A543NFC7_9ACTN|nr:serine/threonine-protein kinase [Haloactinospora alba]TQN30545.1 serine/threonine protein kinase [Haloactinospora alba]
MSPIENSEAERPSAPPDETRTSASGGSGGHRVLKGRYELLDEVARGGVGIVWRATDLTLDREVAVKELRLPPDMSASERDSLLRRTTHEARVAARLTHPGIVTVLDVVDEDERPWIVMELVEARTLDEIVQSTGTLAYQRAAEIGLQLIDALKAAHNEGIVHRDVKPENVMVSEGGRVVLTDFGLATWTGESALTTSGRIIGSPSYIPPERAKAGPVGAESDLWALGATLYKAIEGYPPYDRKGYLRILRGDELEEPSTARNGGPLAPVLAALLRVQPDDRMSADDATKRMRSVALAPWAREPEPAAEQEPEADEDEEPERAESSVDGGDAGDAGSAGSAGDEPEVPPQAEEEGRESAREHFRQGASVLRTSLQESMSESMSSLQERLQRHGHDSMGSLLTSIRDSTDTLGLTNSGRHRDRSALPIAAMVACGVLGLLTVVLWVLISRG